MQIDIGAGAVQDMAGNGIAAATDRPVTVTATDYAEPPAAVNGVIVSSYGQDYVVLTLEAPTGEYPPTDYDILYIPTNCGDGATLFTTQFGARACRFEGETGSTSLTVPVTGLSAGASYTFYPIAEIADQPRSQENLRFL